MNGWFIFGGGCFAGALFILCLVDLLLPNRRTAQLLKDENRRLRERQQDFLDELTETSLILGAVRDALNAAADLDTSQNAPDENLAVVSYAMDALKLIDDEKKVEPHWRENF